MSEIVKNSAPLIIDEINKAKNILLHCHPSPDPDSVGSALAMKFALEGMGKNVTLIQGDNEIPKAFDFPGVGAVEKKSYGEIDASSFDLFIALDAASPKMISFKIDVVFPDSLRVVVIDHHVSNTNYGHINCVDGTYPATAQILSDLFKEMNVRLTHDIALNLFMGMYSDTGGFRYGRVNSSTFRTVAELVDLAPEFAKIIFTMENSNRKESLIFDGLALSSIKEFCGGHLVIASVSNKQIVDNNIDSSKISTHKIVNDIKSVEGYDIGMSIVEIEPGFVKMSFRTRDSNKYDVSKLATALGGGGHRAAGGARLNMTLPEAINKVVETAKIIYDIV
jgi:phosphoesterase RecJ-like protein